MSQEITAVSITAIDKHSSDTMSRTFSTTFQGTENEHMLKSMVLDWEKTEVAPKFGRYHLITSDIIEDYSEEIQEALEKLEVSE